MSDPPNALETGPGGASADHGDTGTAALDLGSLLEQAMGMQEQLMAAQSEAASHVIEGQAGGGAVVVRVTGAMVFESVRISPDAVDPDDVAMLEDLVLAALHDAMDEVAALQQASVAGVDLGGLGELFDAGPIEAGAIDAGAIDADPARDEQA